MEQGMAMGMAMVTALQLTRTDTMKMINRGIFLKKFWVNLGKHKFKRTFIVEGILKNEKNSFNNGWGRVYWF